MTDQRNSGLKRFAVPDPGRRLKVAVVVKTRPPSEECLRRMRFLGLVVEQTIGNKILGSIPPSARNDLAADTDVLEVEEGAQLSLS